MNTFIPNLKLEIIATYSNHNQEWFNCAVKAHAVKSEKNLLNYIKKQLGYGDLIKLSLCWICKKNIVDKYKVIQNSVKINNGKYYFENNKLTKEQKWALI